MSAKIISFSHADAWRSIPRMSPDEWRAWQAAQPDERTPLDRRYSDGCRDNAERARFWCVFAMTWFLCVAITGWFGAFLGWIPGAWLASRPWSEAWKWALGILVVVAALAAFGLIGGF